MRLALIISSVIVVTPCVCLVAFGVVETLSGMVCLSALAMWGVTRKIKDEDSGAYLQRDETKEILAEFPLNFN